MRKILSQLLLCILILGGGGDMALKQIPSYADLDREVRALRAEMDELEHKLDAEGAADVVARLSGQEDLLGATSPFAWAGGSLYANTGAAGAYVRLFPCDNGGVQIVQLPTEGGGFISATFDPDDGGLYGNYYTLDGKAVYFRPDTGLYYIWDPEGQLLYFIRLPGAANWINAVYASAQNGFFTFSPQGGPDDPYITWSAAHGWYTVEGEQDWKPLGFEFPAGYELPAEDNVVPPIALRVALRPEWRDGSYSLEGQTKYPNGEKHWWFLLKYASGIYDHTNNGSAPARFLILYIAEYDGAGALRKASEYYYVFDEIILSDGSALASPGWHVDEKVPDQHQLCPVSAPDLSGFDNVSCAVAKGGATAGFFDGCVLIADAGVE